MNEERKAREELQDVWQTYTASQREQCLYTVTPPVLSSYVNLQGCLDMASHMRPDNTMANTQNLR
jgi:hypothetical protein